VAVVVLPAACAAGRQALCEARNVAELGGVQDRDWNGPLKRSWRGAGNGDCLAAGEIVRHGHGDLGRGRINQCRSGGCAAVPLAGLPLTRS